MRRVHLETGWNVGLTERRDSREMQLLSVGPNGDRAAPWNVSDLSLRLRRRRVLVPTASSIVRVNL